MALRPGQIRCIQTLDKPLVVAAGAGSGKTFTLTKRIVGALQSGFVDDIGQVCAITFTNKAAAELKSRVKSELRACGLVEQSLKADDAWISTIHGMCARILRSHAIELGLDPEFTMADAVQVAAFADRAVDGVLDDARADGSDGAVSALFAEYPATSDGMAASSVEGMLKRLLELASAAPNGVASLRAPSFQASPARLAATALDGYGELLSAAEREKASQSRDSWIASTADGLARARGRLGRGDAADAIQALEMLAPLSVKRNFGSKAFKERAAGTALLVESCIMELRLAAAAPHLETLLRLAGDAQRRFAALKAETGVLDNNDLLVRAADALERHPDIAAGYADRFRLVMVDEFQDTDQMQVDMIKRIAGPGASRLCTVGDAQQSIYRFRGADVSVYRRHLESVRAADPDGVILLPDNFRSHADVLSLVDCVFERGDMFGGEFMSLAPGRDEGQVERPLPQGASRVLVHHVTKSHVKGVPASQVVEEQARRIAGTFAEFAAQGRPLGDMAVLLGRMTNADVYAQALRGRGLPCVVSGGSVFAKSPEAQMVLELARVAANPADTRALWAVLAGPMFCVPDADLLNMATRCDAGGVPRRRSLDAGLRAVGQALQEASYDPLVPVSPQLECAVHVLGRLCCGVLERRMARSLMDAVVDSGWASRLEAQGPEGLAAAGNVYKAIRIIEGIEAGRAVGPVGAMRAFERALQEAKEAPGALSTEGGEFVRIMTVHASKGLEFPIVAVSEFKDVRADSSKLLALPDGDSALLSLDLGRTVERIGGSAAPKSLQALYAGLLEGCDDEESLKRAAREADGALGLRAALSEYGRRGDEEEAKRLLYVALTRARECLVVSLCGSRTKDNPNGIPKNCLAAVVNALEGSGNGFDPGRTSYPFGGAAPAVVEHAALELDPREAAAHEEADMAERPRKSFLVPEAGDGSPSVLVPFNDAHRGMFSYSSVSGASHAGDLLERLASRFAISCDQANLDGQGFHGACEDGADAGMAHVPDGVDASERRAGAAPDADKATDLGTAFHRLAQYAVGVREDGGPLEPPPASRVAALCRACGLDAGQRVRLEAALSRWFGSDEAAAMAACHSLQAEVPFMVPVASPSGETVFLEGEIDLLALNAARLAARVVDYKTGGHPAEDGETLRRKHVLQASCYAYALLLQGVQEVKASFVRVERGRMDDSRQPQCVRYRFAAADRAALEQAIAAAYALAAGE